ncbi:hypothetical protein Y1Q_0007079 [Alligator mississippiensis]|uniref:Uncharacterized protein n=1 Tax=Alligator mississippiensis TaxID=8496 RepID=A0A151N5I4_ALLMI|nr:hypothetical protein Y1Q_0007079 [Alligator mississippiensis]
MKVWGLTFWNRKAYEAFWEKQGQLTKEGRLKGLRFETGEKERERVLFLRMFNDELEKEDVERWLERQVQSVMWVERVMDKYKIWPAESILCTSSLKKMRHECWRNYKTEGLYCNSEQAENYKKSFTRNRKESVNESVQFNHSASLRWIKLNVDSSLHLVSKQHVPPGYPKETRGVSFPLL